MAADTMTTDTAALVKAMEDIVKNSTATESLVRIMRTSANAIYVATDKAVADDIHAILDKAADLIERLGAEVTRDELGAACKAYKQERNAVNRWAMMEALKAFQTRRLSNG